MQMNEIFSSYGIVSTAKISSNSPPAKTFRWNTAYRSNDPRSISPLIAGFGFGSDGVLNCNTDSSPSSQNCLIVLKIVGGVMPTLFAIFPCDSSLPMFVLSARIIYARFLNVFEVVLLFTTACE
jgi:hypothetical protein